MPIRRRYRQVAENKLATFDAVNSATGIGHQKLFAVTSGAASTVAGGILSPNATGSSVLFRTTTAGGLAFDLDWDLKYERTQILQGPLFGTYTFDLDNQSARLDIHVIKVDSSGSETEIAFASGSLLASGAAQRSARGSTVVELPKTAFKVGQTLRINTKYWVTASGQTTRLYMSGDNRFDTQFQDIDAGEATDRNATDMFFLIPSKVDSI